MLQLEGILGTDALAPRGWEMEAQAEVVVPCGSHIPYICGTCCPGASCFWWVENDGSHGSWCKGVAIKIMDALQGIICEDLWVFTRGT